jgi:hypothetical protein
MCTYISVYLHHYNNNDNITSDGAIMMKHFNNDLIKIINCTSYLPLCIFGDIILMTNGKLCRLYVNRKLLEIKIESRYDYIVNDYTDKFAKIN